MRCTISCSFGEVVDKASILKIKLASTKEENAVHNIKSELRAIQKEVPEVNIKDPLFDELFDVNTTLWKLEDTIRSKSHKKEFDEQYIKCAETIHIQNDVRYDLKRRINNNYNSQFKEEKVYSTRNIIDAKDVVDLGRGKYLYQIGGFEKSYDLLNGLMKKYDSYVRYDNFLVDLLFAYNNSCSVLNKKNTNMYRINEVMRVLDTLDLSYELEEYCKVNYPLVCLHALDYKSAYNFLNNLNNINSSTKRHGVYVNKATMSFFKSNDVNKTLLVYDGGGIGDNFMYARFIPILSSRYIENKLIFILNHKLKWIFESAFAAIENVSVISYDDKHMAHFDYHCNLMSLIKFMEYTYGTIPFTPIFTGVTVSPSPLVAGILRELDTTNKKTYILNWKGASLNPHEKYNRKIELKEACKLFQTCDNIHWVVITKDVTDYEREILKKYNVKYYGDIIDTSVNAFIDTVSIVRHVDGVISTDTSILHLSANLDIQTYAMLTVGCEWRWTRECKTTNWYPKISIIRQAKYGDWSGVIDGVINLIA